MADTAAWLVDSVLVGVPVRQWVLPLPWALRRRVAYDSAVCGTILRIFISVVGDWLSSVGGGQGQHGAVTFIQRAGSALNLNPHFHTLMPDGVYDETPEGEVLFRAAPAPTRAQLEQLVVRIAERTVAHLRRLDQSGSSDEPSALDQCADASVGRRQLLGCQPGQPEARVYVEGASTAYSAGLCAAVAGFNLHAGVAIDDGDYSRLERLCRYVARPPLATERLRERPDGRFALDFKRAWRDGTAGIVLDPLDLMARLAALVPPPRVNLVRYHGVFAPAARLRGRIIGQPPLRVAQIHRNRVPLGEGARPRTRRPLVQSET